MPCIMSKTCFQGLVEQQEQSATAAGELQANVSTQHVTQGKECGMQCSSLTYLHVHGTKILKIPRQ